MKRIKEFFARLPISLCGPAVIYPILFAAALIFAQMYRSAVSHVLFMLVALLPIASAVYLLVARLCLYAALRIPKKTVRKQTHLSITADIESRIPFVFPFVEAVIVLPDEGGIYFEKSRFITSVIPFHNCTVSRSAYFALCGEYELRFSHLYVYDLTRSVRIRIKVDKRESVLVLPRNMDLPTTAPVADGNFAAQNGGDNTPNIHTDPIDVREYVAGDSLRRIHWKLFSKSDELFVRERTEGENATAFIFCDLETVHKVKNAYATEELILCNAVLECAAIAAQDALNAQNAVYLLYVHEGVPHIEHPANNADLYSIYRRFLSAKPSDTTDQIKLLVGTVDMPQNASVTVVSAHAEAESIEKYASVLGTCGANIIVCTNKGGHQLPELALPETVVHQIYI